MDATEIKKSFAKNVRQRREQAALSVAELARRSGLPLRMLEKLDQGIVSSKMTVEDAAALAHVFNCEAYELFG